LVRGEVSGGTAGELGEAGPGRARGCLGLGSKPLPLHGVDHRGASWGPGRAPLHARGIRTATPPAGVSTEPLGGKRAGPANTSKARASAASISPWEGRSYHREGGKRQEKTAAQRLSATLAVSRTQWPQRGTSRGYWVSVPLRGSAGVSCGP